MSQRKEIADSSPPDHAAPFLILVPHEMPTNTQMWPSVICPKTAAVPACETPSAAGRGRRPLPPHTHRHSPAAIFDTPPSAPQHTAEGRGGHLVAAPPGEPAPPSPSNGGGAGRCVAWRWTHRNRCGGQSRGSWWYGGGSLRGGGAEPFSQSGGGEGSVEKREPLPRVSAESRVPRPPVSVTGCSGCRPAAPGAPGLCTFNLVPRQWQPRRSCAQLSVFYSPTEAAACSTKFESQGEVSKV